MRITHLQSSSQLVDLGSVRVLTDPWLTEGEYYGSWFHYPPFLDQEIESLEYDYIYVSHIHPDHLSERTFRALSAKRPVLIHNYESKFVKRKLEMLEFEVIELDNAKPYDLGNQSSITIYAADNCDPEACGKFMGCGIVEKTFGSTQIDTLAVFSSDESIVVNTNDCPFELALETILKNKINDLDVDLLLVGYGGAGPYPQCFTFETELEMKVAAQRKQDQFLKQAVKFVDLVKPKKYAPFAGTYVLGSRLTTLTEFRGVPSVAEATRYIDNQTSHKYTGILLEKLDAYDTKTEILTKGQDFDGPSWPEYLARIAQLPLDYDADSWDEGELTSLIDNAYIRFKEKCKDIGFESSTQIIVNSEKIRFSFSPIDEPRLLDENEFLPGGFVEIKLDHNLLNRLLRGPRYAHWNNAEIGSHLRYVRKPDVFERGLYHSLCFFHA